MQGVTMLKVLPQQLVSLVRSPLGTVRTIPIWKSLKNAPPVAISLIVHGCVIVALGVGMEAVRHTVLGDEEELAVDSVIDDVRMQNEFSQALQTNTATSQTLALVGGGGGGGAAAASIGSGGGGGSGSGSGSGGTGSGGALSQAGLGNSEVVRDATIRVGTIGSISIPGGGQLGMDFGEGEIGGETGARVPGYDVAMHRLTLELTRMMRQQPVLAVWLFDASGSLRDDRAEIRDNFHKIYEELGIASKLAEGQGQRFSPLETVVAQFGSEVKELTNGATSDIEEIRNAIDQVQDDPSGEEQLFTSIEMMIERYGRSTGRTDRKLVIIALTDETGNDHERVEETILAAEKFRSPVYILGREAIFGYPIAHVHWVDEVTGLGNWIPVDRGPETAKFECLQYDGFTGRSDAASSGFGPYAQLRLVRESGGIYFVLAREEADLLGAQARMQRNFDDLAMKEYEPLLDPVREYEAARSQSEFRNAVWEVIVRLNPAENYDPELNLQRWHYPLAADMFAQRGLEQFQRGKRSLEVLDQAVAMLERVRPLRAEETELRWRAAFDLAYAQCLAYRVRQFQFLLALDRHTKDNPLPSDPIHNVWNMAHVQEMIEPDPKVVADTGIDLGVLEKQRLKALEMYEFVIQEHPGTPWAQRAEYERSLGFGITFYSGFLDPRYGDPEYQARIPRL
jgi:hypothetical protein